MIKFTCLMRWVDQAQQWYMINRATDKFVFNFFDCENTHKVFQGLDKGEDTIYTVLVKKEVVDESK